MRLAAIIILERRSAAGQGALSAGEAVEGRAGLRVAATAPAAGVVRTVAIRTPASATTTATTAAFRLLRRFLAARSFDLVTLAGLICAGLSVDIIVAVVSIAGCVVHDLERVLRLHWRAGIGSLHHALAIRLRLLHAVLAVLLLRRLHGGVG